MHKIKQMVNCIIDSMNEQIDNGIDEVNTDEFGKVADIVKDLYMAIYYCKKSGCDEYELTMDEYKKHSAEELREMDKQRGVAYYTTSAIDKFRDAKSVGDSEMSLKATEEYLNNISDEVNDLLPMMDNSERTMMRTKMQMILQRI